MNSDSVISFGITQEQAEILCKYYNKDIRKIEGYEVCELLDRTIDDLAKLLEN